MNLIKKITVVKQGQWEGVENFGDSTVDIKFTASPELFLIRVAWEGGCEQIEEECDGFGAGMGTHGDWSGIRDSSPEAIDRMLSSALNFIQEVVLG